MNNNLRIEPGKYVWDIDVSFENIIEILDFTLVQETEEFIIFKSNTFSIEEDQVLDWQKARDHFRYWLSNRAYIKVIEHMRDNDMKIASGEYNLKQSTNYNNAMGIFEFDRIMNPSLLEIQESIAILNNYNWIDINKVLYFWLKPEDRISLMVYMYNRDLSSKRGEYIIKQDMSWEEVVQLFEFVTID